MFFIVPLMVLTVPLLVPLLPPASFTAIINDIKSRKGGQQSNEGDRVVDTPGKVQH